MAKAVIRRNHLIFDSALILLKTVTFTVKK